MFVSSDGETNMSAQIILFPGCEWVPARPWFGDWLTERVGGKWVVRKCRTKTWRGLSMANRVQLPPREYEAYEREYEAVYGPIYGAA